MSTPVEHDVSAPLWAAKYLEEHARRYAVYICVVDDDGEHRAPLPDKPSVSVTTMPVPSFMWIGGDDEFSV